MEKGTKSFTLLSTNLAISNVDEGRRRLKGFRQSLELKKNL